MEWTQLLKIPIADKVEKEQLKDLVPQKGKMFLLDSVESYDLKTMTITCLKEISEDNIFYKADLEGIPAFTSFEMMAQAIAALQTIKKIKNQEEIRNRQNRSLMRADQKQIDERQKIRENHQVEGRVLQCVVDIYIAEKGNN